MESDLLNMFGEDSKVVQNVWGTPNHYTIFCLVEKFFVLIKKMAKLKIIESNYIQQLNCRVPWSKKIPPSQKLKAS